MCTECDESGNLVSWQQFRQHDATYISALTTVEMIQAADQYIDENVMQIVPFSPVLVRMCNILTDLKNQIDLPICITK